MLGGNGSFDPRLGYNPERRAPSFSFEGEGRVSRGLSLAAKSWAVVRDDKRLLVLPLLQLVTQAAVAALVIGPIGYEAYQQASRWVFLIGFAAFAFPLNFLATFFGVAFVAAVRAHLDDKQMTVAESLRFAASRLDAITGWAIVSTVVSVALQALERVRGGALAARIAAWIVGIAWDVAALFVIPALATERIGPIKAARRSADVVKEKWPEGIVGATVIGISFGLVLIPVVILGCIGWGAFSSSPVVGGVLIGIAVFGFLLISAAQAAVDGVFRYVLFDYAAHGTVHAPFTVADLEAGVKYKKHRLRDWFGG